MGHPAESTGVRVLQDPSSGGEGGGRGRGANISGIIGFLLGGATSCVHVAMMLAKLDLEQGSATLNPQRATKVLIGSPPPHSILEPTGSPVPPP